MKTIALLVMTMLAASAFGAEMYRWVDEKGVVNYASYPPPPNIKKLETKRIGSNAAQPVEPSYALAQAVKNYPITLFATDCGEICNSARTHLKKRGIPYTEKNPISPNDVEEFRKVSGGGMEIPLLVVGSLKTIKGYQAIDWDTTFDQAGYPSSALPGAKVAEVPPPEKK